MIPAAGAPAALLFDERIAQVASDGVAHLHRRGLHVVGGGRLQRSRHAARHAEPGAADRVDDDAGAVGRILDREAHLELDRGAAEPAPFHADEGDLVIVLPGHIVGRADMDVARGETPVQLRLDGFRLGDLLRTQPVQGLHVEEVGVAAGVQLVGAVERVAPVPEQARHQPVGDGGAHLALDVVAHDRHPGLPEPLRPCGRRGDEHGDAVHHGRSRVEAGLGVMRRRLLRADRQVADHYLGAGPLQHVDDLDRVVICRPERLVLRIVRHVRRHAVEDGTHLDGDAGGREIVLEDHCAIGFGEDGFLKRPADLSLVDVERGDHLQISRPPASDIGVHEARQSLGVPIPVVSDALDQRTRAITDPRNGNLDMIRGLPDAQHYFLPVFFRTRCRLLWLFSGADRVMCEL